MLFGTKPDQVHLLNKAAPSFYHMVQGALWENLLLHLCRLTDPRQSVGKDNLTVQRLPDLVADAIRPTVEDLVQCRIVKSDFARDWRKRHIAHKDLALAIGKSVPPLAPATWKGFQTALESLVSLLNIVERHSKNASTAYDLIPSNGNAEALLYVLRNGLDSETERRYRFKKGKILPAEIQGKPAI